MENNFKVDRKALKVALDRAAKVIERRNTIPILSNVLFRFERDCVTMIATDLDLMLEEQLPAATEGEGALTLQLQALRDAVKKFKGEFITIADMGGGPREGKASVTDGTARVTMGTLSAADFPVTVRGDMLAEFTAPVSGFAGAIARVLPFVSTEETRYYLQGVYIHPVCSNPPEPTAEHKAAQAALRELRERESAFKAAYRIRVHMTDDEKAEADPLPDWTDDDKAQLQAVVQVCDAFERERCVPDVIRFATTDGHRLGRVTYPLFGISADQKVMRDAARNMPGVILPTKACKLLDYIIGKKPERPDLGVAMNAAKVEFTYGRTRILAKVIDGTFPDYSRVIPTSNDHKLTVPAIALADAIDGVTAVCNERTRGLTLAMNSDDAGALILSAESAEGSKAAQVFEGTSYVQPEGFGDASRVLGVNAAYLKQCLTSFGDVDVTLSIADEAAPILIEAADIADLTVVLMPMRTGTGITTRADVDSLNLNALQTLSRKAADIAKVYADVADAEPGVRGPILRAVYDSYIAPAIAFLVDGGSTRQLARLRAKVALAEGAGDDATVASLARLISLLTAEPSGSFAELARLGRYTAPVAVAAESAPVAPVAESQPVADADIADVTDAPAAEPVQDPGDNGSAEPFDQAAFDAEHGLIPCVDVVKVLTLTDQAVYVPADQWADPARAVLDRYHKDGQRFYGNGGAKTVLRSNIARQVLPRNSAAKPIAKPVAAQPAQPIDSDVTARLATLERIVAGLAAPAVDRPKRSAAHMRAIRAYLALRAKRVEASHAAQLSRSFEQRWEREKVRVADALSMRDEAVDRAEILETRCTALERLHLVSGRLDTAAPVDGQPKPSIILPVTATSAR